MYWTTEILRPKISIRNPIDRNNKWMRITGRHWIGSYSTYANQDYEKITANGKHVGALFRTGAFMYKIGLILIGSMHSVRWPLRNVWT